MILMLESTSVFQRQRTLKTLSGMAAKPYTLLVFRTKQWVPLPTTELLPGDLISLKPPNKPTAVATTAAAGSAEAAAAAAQAKAAALATASEIIPCDCVVLRGAALVNEATLTGESVPQMKDALPNDCAAELLDVEGRDRVHTLFAGTSLVTASASAVSADGDGKEGEARAAAAAAAAAAGGRLPGVPPTPDGGCVCTVLRTGFSSSQGELMQMIEFSQAKVTDDSRETMWALLLLLGFALAASGYVFKAGLEKGDRTTHELLLKCVIIITSVVPRHLPLQVRRQPIPTTTTSSSTSPPPPPATDGDGGEHGADGADEEGDLLHRAVPRPLRRQGRRRSLRQDGHPHLRPPPARVRRQRDGLFRPEAAAGGRRVGRGGDGARWLSLPRRHRRWPSGGRSDRTGGARGPRLGV